MKYFEAFAGIGGGALAVRNVYGRSAKSVGFSEIYKPAIKVYNQHFEGHVNLGSITNFKPSEVPIHDLFIAGFPCKNLTRLSAEKRKNLKGKHSGLFYPMSKIIKAGRCKHFIIENVESMDDDARDTISEVLGVEPIMIPSALVSAQDRKRYYWCSFPTTLPKDRNIKFQDIIEQDGKHKYACAWSRSTRRIVVEGKVVDRWIDERIRFNDKSNTLVSGVGCSAFSSKNIIITRKPKNGYVTNKYREKSDSLLEVLKWRHLLPVECERLQTFPDGWTSSVTDNQAYNLIGNSFTVEVISHLLRCYKGFLRE